MLKKGYNFSMAMTIYYWLVNGYIFDKNGYFFGGYNFGCFIFRVVKRHSKLFSNCHVSWDKVILYPQSGEYYEERNVVKI